MMQWFIRAGLMIVALLAFLIASPSTPGQEKPGPEKDKKDIAKAFVYAERVNQAVKQGVEWLRARQAADGTFPYEQIGMTALAGLTLLECGVSRDDPGIAKALKLVRE